MLQSSKNLLKCFVSGLICCYAAYKASDYAYRTGVSVTIEKSYDYRQKGGDLNKAYDEDGDELCNKSNRHGR